jgi:hypothetical protein
MKPHLFQLPLSAFALAVALTTTGCSINFPSNITISPDPPRVVQLSVSPGVATTVQPSGSPQRWMVKLDKVVSLDNESVFARFNLNLNKAETYEGALIGREFVVKFDCPWFDLTLDPPGYSATVNTSQTITIRRFKIDPKAPENERGIARCLVSVFDISDENRRVVISEITFQRPMQLQ